MQVTAQDGERTFRVSTRVPRPRGERRANEENEKNGMEKRLCLERWNDVWNGNAFLRFHRVFLHVIFSVFCLRCPRTCWVPQCPMWLQSHLGKTEKMVKSDKKDTLSQKNWENIKKSENMSKNCYKFGKSAAKVCEEKKRQAKKRYVKYVKYKYLVEKFKNMFQQPSRCSNDIMRYNDTWWISTWKPRNMF